MTADYDFVAGKGTEPSIDDGALEWASDLNLDNLSTFGATSPTVDVLVAAQEVGGEPQKTPISEIPFAKLKLDITAGESVGVGEMAWNAEAGTVDIGRPDGGATQLGQEIILAERPRNKQGVQINNGECVYISGATGGIPEVKLGNAGLLNARHTIAVATGDVAIEGRGAYTTKGVVRDFDTSAFAVNDMVYLDIIDGLLRNTPPVFPNWTIRIGIILVSSATVGVLDVDVKNGRGEDLGNFFAGTFREGFNALVTSTGGVITLSLQSDAASDLTMQFSTGEVALDCTPAKTIILTAGTISVPQENYVYIPIATKILTLHPTQWPSTEHIKVAYIYAQTAAYVEDDGALINQNWNDPLYHASGGHLPHITERIRADGATWYSGLDGEGADDYTTSAAGVVTAQVGAGVLWQMHKQTIAAKDTSGTDDMHVINHDTTPYFQTQNLYDVIYDAVGGTLTNRYFNIILISVGNKMGEYSPLLVNLPIGSYNSLAGAEADSSAYDVFDIPRAFTKESSTAALVCRMTFRKTGGTWAYQSTVNLRGTTPSTASGGAPGGATTNFSDSLFTIFNNIDSTKIIDVDASAIATGNTRTITMPDKDVTLGAGNTEQSIAYSATIAPDLSSGNVVKVGALTGNITVNNPTNPTTAEEVYIRFLQDGTGGRTVALGSDYVLLDSNPNYPTGPNEVFYFSGIVQSDGTIEGGYSPVTSSTVAVPSNPNILINSNFEANQQAVTGSVVLSAGVYGHDGFYAGSGGCTYTFAKSNGVTTLTVSAGTLIQATEANAIVPGEHTLSWGGTAEASLDEGSSAVSPVTETMTGGVSVECEWGTGTIFRVKLEEGPVNTPHRIDDNCFVESPQILKRFQRINGITAAGMIGVGYAPTTTTCIFVVSHPKLISGAWTAVFGGSPIVSGNTGQFVTGISATDRADGATTLTVTVAAGLTQWNVYTLKLNGGYLDLDATGLI